MVLFKPLILSSCLNIEVYSEELSHIKFEKVESRVSIMPFIKVSKLNTQGFILNILNGFLF